MKKQNEDYITQIKENEELRETLKKFSEQVTARDQYFESQVKTKDLQIQIAEAKYEHQVAQSKEDTAKAQMILEKSQAQSDRELELQVST